MSKVNFGNSANWELVDTNFIRASTNTTSKGELAFIPIATQNLPFLIESNTIAVLLQTELKKTTWFTGGYISFNIATGLTVGGNLNSGIKKARIPLDEITIVTAPRLASNFSLSLTPPYYFKYFQWYVWEYIGEGTADPEGKLDLLIDNLI